jgi:hypothetical protein
VESDPFSRDQGSVIISFRINDINIIRAVVPDQSEEEVVLAFVGSI